MTRFPGVVDLRVSIFILLIPPNIFMHTAVSWLDEGLARQDTLGAWQVYMVRKHDADESDWMVWTHSTHQAYIELEVSHDKWYT